MNKMYSIKAYIDKILNIVFVKKCVACRKLLPYDYVGKLCSDCEEEWEESKDEICPNCYKQQIKCRCGFGKSDVDSVRHLALYDHNNFDSVTNRLIYALKKCNSSDVFDFIADQMIENIISKEHLDNTVCVNVPRNPRAVRRYGYDHAKVLAKLIAGKLNIEYVDALVHIGGKSEQKKLNHIQRYENAKKNCRIDPSCVEKIKGKRVLLVDDIGTTGAMSKVCSMLLKQNGAVRVDCVLAAKNEFNKY